MDTLSYILGQNAINPACVDLLIDICRSGGVDVASNAPQIINNIFARLKTKNLMYKTKSKLYAALGAIAEIIGPAYDHYLKTTIDALIAGVNSAEELVTQDEMNDLEEDSEECEYLEMLLVILPQTFMQLLNAVPIQSPRMLFINFNYYYFEMPTLTYLSSCGKSWGMGDLLETDCYSSEDYATLFVTNDQTRAYGIHDAWIVHG
jgi:hypothetical protein